MDTLAILRIAIVDTEALRENLLELRIRKGWSQVERGSEAGVRADTVSSVERGKHEPRPSTLRRLAGALDVDVADLFVKESEAQRENTSLFSEALGERIAIEDTDMIGVTDSVEAQTVRVSVGLYWRVLRAAKGDRELEPDVLHRAEKALEQLSV